MRHIRLLSLGGMKRAVIIVTRLGLQSLYFRLHGNLKIVCRYKSVLKDQLLEIDKLCLSADGPKQLGQWGTAYGWLAAGSPPIAITSLKAMHPMHNHYESFAQLKRQSTVH